MGDAFAAAGAGGGAACRAERLPELDLAPAGVPQKISWLVVALVGGGALLVGVLIVLLVFSR